MEIDIRKISSRYGVRKLTEEDVDRVYELALGNPMYYRYCPPFVTRDSILKDMKALPSRARAEDKYYIGFFKGERLAAVMDLILSCPNPRTAFIGFFMVSKEEQGKGTGSEIVNECFRYLQDRGFCFIRLGFAMGNPQSEAFWRKNGFEDTGLELENDGYRVAVMQRELNF